MSLTARMQASMRRMGAHFHGAGTIVLRPGTEGVTTSNAIPCSAPNPSRVDLAPENGEQGEIRLFVSAAEPALTFVPEPKHWGQLDSQWYRIVGTTRLKGDNGVIGYELDLRARE